MDLDYDAYAEGEALLGWLNATVRVRVAAGSIDGNALVLELADAIGGRIREAGCELAHLKMTLDAPGAGGLSAVSVVASGEEPDLRESLLGEIREGSLIVNLRAEADPDLLERWTRAGLAAVAETRSGLAFEVEHLERFRPARPVPTHRVSGGLQ
jgi:hypothetical protein